MTMAPAPKSPEAENAVLGSALIDPETIDILTELLTPEHFYSESNRKIYQTIVSLWEEGSETDSVTVTERLRVKGVLDEVGGITYIAGLMQDNPGAWLAEQHAHLMRETHRLRQLQQLARRIEGHVTGGHESNDVIHLAEQSLTEITGEQDSKILTSQYLEEAESILNDDMGGYVQTGFYNLDRILGGLKGVVILAARPSSGKSSVARDITRNITKRGEKVALLSPDQSGADIFRLEASLRSGVSLTTIKGRQYSLDDANRWKRALHDYKNESEDKIMLDDRPLNLPSLTARFRAAARWGASTVIVDYMQLVDVPGMRANEEYATVTATSKILKRLSRECGIPVLALAQLNRGAEGRSNPRPVMSDLRSSGQIEQDADSIVFVHRPHKEEPDPYEPVEFIVAKQKDGPTGVVHLTFKREFSTFLDT